MTIQELIDHCKENNIPLDTNIALTAKDDYMLTKDLVAMGKPYFGNCINGSIWERDNAPRDENDEIDYDNMPNWLMLDTGRG